MPPAFGDVNYRWVRHGDGTVGRYWHLTRDGAFVNVGQMVEPSVLIGLSGATGLETGFPAHLCIMGRSPPTDGRDPSLVETQLRSHGDRGCGPAGEVCVRFQHVREITTSMSRSRRMFRRSMLRVARPDVNVPFGVYFDSCFGH